jgi:putative methyltransferase
MSVYFDAVSIIQTPSKEGGSFKSRIYNNSKNLHSSPAQVFALVTETAKWDILLKEVIENSGLLLREQKVCHVTQLYNTIQFPMPGRRYISLAHAD